MDGACTTFYWMLLIIFTLFHVDFKSSAHQNYYSESKNMANMQCTFILIGGTVRSVTLQYLIEAENSV